MKNVYILPTGDEIKSGIVLDIDSVEIMRQILRLYPQAQITRLAPLVDEQDAIIKSINNVTAHKPDVIVLIGGSGGGHRHSETLGKDFTHTALDAFLDEKAIREIYGKNGHLWCRIVCGKKDDTLVFNLPGPYEEAKAACAAFLHAYSNGCSVSETCDRIAMAVFVQYPNGAALEPATQY